MRIRHCVVSAALILSACTADPEPYVIVTSDIHLSNPTGRWPTTTKRFENFLKSLKNAPPQILFVVGDVIDNVRPSPTDGVMAGDGDYWSDEVNIYRSLQRLVPETQFRQTLGPGHDFIAPVSLELAEKELGPRNGSLQWGKYKFIWTTIHDASFWPPGGRYVNSMAKVDYAWLTKELRSTQNAILLFHVPLRTEINFLYGKWPGGLNLTIDPRDRLYTIIDNHASRIRAIFNGHIHKFAQSEYQGIPLYLCPFFDQDCFCKVYADPRALRIEPTNCS